MAESTQLVCAESGCSCTNYCWDMDALALFCITLGREGTAPYTCQCCRHRKARTLSMRVHMHSLILLSQTAHYPRTIRDRQLSQLSLDEIERVSGLMNRLELDEVTFEVDLSEAEANSAALAARASAERGRIAKVGGAFEVNVGGDVVRCQKMRITLRKSAHGRVPHDGGEQQTPTPSSNNSSLNHPQNPTTPSISAPIAASGVADNAVRSSGSQPVSAPPDQPRSQGSHTQSRTQTQTQHAVAPVSANVFVSNPAPPAPIALPALAPVTLPTFILAAPDRECSTQQFTIPDFRNSGIPQERMCYNGGPAHLFAILPNSISIERQSVSYVNQLSYHREHHAESFNLGVNVIGGSLGIGFAEQATVEDYGALQLVGAHFANGRLKFNTMQCWACGYQPPQNQLDILERLTAGEAPRGLCWGYATEETFAQLANSAAAIALQHRN